MHFGVKLWDFPPSTDFNCTSLADMILGKRNRQSVRDSSMMLYSVKSVSSYHVHQFWWFLLKMYIPGREVQIESLWRFLFFFSRRMSGERKQISEHLKWGNLTSLSFRSYSETLHNIFKCYHVHQGFFYIASLRLILILLTRQSSSTVKY